MKVTGILRLFLGKKPAKAKKAQKKKRAFGLSALDFLGCRVLDLIEGRWWEELWKPDF